MVLHARDYPIKYWQTETYLEIWRALRWWPNGRKAAALIGRETLWDWDWGPGPPNRQSSKSFMFSEKSEFFPFFQGMFYQMCCWDWVGSPPEGLWRRNWGKHKVFGALTLSQKTKTESSLILHFCTKWFCALRCGNQNSRLAQTLNIKLQNQFWFMMKGRKLHHPYYLLPEVLGMLSNRNFSRSEKFLTVSIYL